MTIQRSGGPFLYDDETGNKIVGVKHADGSEMSFPWAGNVSSGAWVRPASVFRLRLIGTGAVTIDSRDALGVVSSAVATFTAAAATNQIEFPYLGDGAIEMRATFPSTMTVEVL